MDHKTWLGLPAAERIAAVGHRRYTGGADPEMWYGIGKLQYHFLVMQGLQPQHKFLDIACGALRLGQFLIPYLKAGNYQGLDAQKELSDLALEHELPADLVADRKPVFQYNREFDFTGFKKPKFAMAQSLFTHLLEEDIRLCLRNFREIAQKDTKFFFTYFDGDRSRNPTDRSHPNMNFFYRYEELEGFAAEEGWTTTLIGHWNHPRDQRMIMAQPKK